MSENGKSNGDGPIISIPRVGLSLAGALLVLLVPLSDSFTREIRVTAAAGALMALLWFTEAVPMGMTALLPLIIFPLAGIQTAEKTAAPYANSAVFLFLGGFLVAATVERWGLHRRIARRVLAAVGTDPWRIVLAVLLVTVSLSMWISNTATTLMMCPIAVALVKALGEGDDTRRLAEATILAVAYGASVGGIGTPIGTPTNLIFFGAARELFPNIAPISFAQWMAFAAVYLVMVVPFVWVMLIVTGKVKRGASVPIESLGLNVPPRMSRGEVAASILCAITALLWVFRADIPLGGFTIPGWSSLFPQSRMINDATVAITMAVAAFLIPVEGKRRLLDWSEFRRVPWDVLILFGGGFALADALEVSGLSKWAGNNLSFVGSWPPVAMVLVLCLAVTLLSEVASNVATATAMMPVTAALAVSIGVHPYFLMVPTVLAASSGFMLPVATAPNTIVYGTGYVRVRQMTRAGFLLDLVCALVITFLIFAVIPRVLGLELR